MKDYRFTQPVSMQCTQEQYEKYLEKPLKELGYVPILIGNWESFPLLITKFNGENDKLSNTLFQNNKIATRYYIDHFNPELFLAIAAMTDKKDGIKGEWWKFKGAGYENFTEDKLYMQENDSIDSYKCFVDDKFDLNGFHPYTSTYFTKPTLEELVNHFTESKFENKPNMRTITHTDAKKLIKAACDEWKEDLILHWADKICIESEKIEVHDAYYAKMRKDATPAQHKVLDEVFGKECKFEDGELYVCKNSGITIVLAYDKSREVFTNLVGEWDESSFYSIQKLTSTNIKHLFPKQL